jgi:type VI secretion system protein VasJ
MTDSLPEASSPQPPVAQPPASAPVDPAAAKFAVLTKPFADPIPGVEPGGENARHDERHEAIRNEVEKLSRPSGEEVDWDLVRDSGRALLTEKSKDYLIASYFAVAAYMRGGPRGLIEGIASICALLDRYWESGFPPPNRLRARINALDWFIDRVGSQGHLAPTTIQEGDLQMLSQAAQTLEALVLERFQDDMPNIHRLKEALKPIELAIAGQTPSAPVPEPQQPTTVAASTSEPQSMEQAPSPAVAQAVPPPAVASGDPIAAKFAELGRPFATPIPGGIRAGENARHDALHEAIRNEVDKLGKPTAEQVDWDMIRDTGRVLLTDKSKDYLIASYFAVASYVRGGVQGLVIGIAALVTLLRDYWDDGFPPAKRIRARINAIDWFIERVESLGDLAPKAVEKNDLQLLSMAAKELETLVLDRFQDDMPNIHGLKTTLNTIELAIAKQAPAPAQPQLQQAAAPHATAGSPAPAPSAPAVSVQLAAPTAELADPAQVSKFLKDVGESLHKASRALFKISKEDPLAYRLCREGLYIHFLQAPPASNGNQTMVPAPPADREATLNTLLSSQNWPMLLDEAESGLASARLWLDLHRYVALALAGLGYDKARDTVVAETAVIVQRLPELLDREFSDGQPFASAATREWLDAASPSASASAESDVSLEGDSGAFEASLGEAHKLAVGGKLEDAIQRLTEIIKLEAGVGRDRFRAKLAMAKACAAAGSPALAEGILAGLSEEIRDFRLEEWEPKIAEACYRSRYEALAAMANESAKSREEVVDVYRQLCRVAPASALKLGKPPSGSDR